MSLIKMIRQNEIKLGLQPETVGEDGAEIIVVSSKANFQKKKRKPIIPNRNGVDRIEILDQSSDYVDVSCRFLHKDAKPTENVQIRIPLPHKKAVTSILKRKHPNRKPTNREIKQWYSDYVKDKIRRCRNKNMKAEEKLFSENSIGDI